MRRKPRKLTEFHLITLHCEESRRVKLRPVGEASLCQWLGGQERSRMASISTYEDGKTRGGKSHKNVWRTVFQSRRMPLRSRYNRWASRKQEKLLGKLRFVFSIILEKTFQLLIRKESRPQIASWDQRRRHGN